MSMLSTSWQSSSLAFVSPQNHQQGSVRPLTTRQPRFSLPSRSKMAKIGSIVVVGLLVLVVVGFVVGEAVSEPEAETERPRVRSRSSPAKRRRLSGGPSARIKQETTELPPTTEESSIITEVEGVLLADVANEDIELIRSTEAPSGGRTAKSRKSQRSQTTTTTERHERVQQQRGPGQEGCDECDLTACKNPPENSCAAGKILDSCSCCFTCGIGEGNRCYNASIPNLAYNSDIGMCGTGLSCVLRSDLDPSEPREALCECRNPKLVCGNDNQTYTSECKIRETAHHKSGLAIASWGPCVSAPWMPTPIESATFSDGEDLSFSCEVKGFPNPIIHWEFLSDDFNRVPVILPGDDSSVVITVRGGPEETTTTSWIQIISVTNLRQGTYYCVARNAVGEARSSATARVARHGILSRHNEN